MDQSYYRKVIHEELARRCGRNPRYSLRAFARALGTDAAALSRILADKKVPSRKMADKIIANLEMSPSEQAKFHASLREKQRGRKLESFGRFFASEPSLEPSPEASRRLTNEIFHVIADWYHYAILELTFLPGFKPDAGWIAQKLEISHAEAQLALKRLLELGLLEQDNKGKVIKTDAKISMIDTQNSNAGIQRRNKQILKKAIEAIDKHPVHLRSATTMTMAIDPGKLPAAKKMMLKFNRELCAFLESGDRKLVYELTLNLFPLSQTGPISEK